MYIYICGSGIYVVAAMYQSVVAQFFVFIVCCRAGNLLTVGSTCHGAGRAQSRNKSRRALHYTEVLDKLAAQGIAIRVASPKLGECSFDRHEDIHACCSNASLIMLLICVALAVASIYCCSYIALLSTLNVIRRHSLCNILTPNPRHAI